MRHHNSKRKFGRERKVRVALMRSLAVALVTKGKITTTEAKAKELRPFVEKLVTKGRVNTLAARRNATAAIGVRAAKKLIEGVAPKYASTPGGYTRIIRMPARKSDGSPMAVIEFV